MLHATTIAATMLATLAVPMEPTWAGDADSLASYQDGIDPGADAERADDDRRPRAYAAMLPHAMESDPASNPDGAACVNALREFRLSEAIGIATWEAYARAVVLAAAGAGAGDWGAVRSLADASYAANGAGSARERDYRRATRACRNIPGAFARW